MQETEIIKLNSLKNSLSTLMDNLTSKLHSSKDYDITVIVKESDQLSEGTLSEPSKL